MLISQPLRNLPIKARSTTSVRATTKNSLMQLLKSSQEPLTNERSADRPSWLPVSLLTVARCRRSRLGLSWKLHLEFAADCGTDDEQLGSNANVPDGIQGYPLGRDSSNNPSLATPSATTYARRLRRRRSSLQEWPAQDEPCSNVGNVGGHLSPRLFHLTYR